MAALAGFANIGKVPELRRRIIFTLIIVAIYRVGVFVTLPFTASTAWIVHQVVKGQGGLLGLFNTFSGGALANLSIFALGHHAVRISQHHHAADGPGESKQVEELQERGRSRSPQARAMDAATARSRCRAFSRSASQ